MAGNSKRRSRGRENDVVIKNVLNCYMELRLLSTMYNHSMGRSFLPYFKTALGLTASGSLIAFVKLFAFGKILFLGSAPFVF